MTPRPVGDTLRLMTPLLLLLSALAWASDAPMKEKPVLSGVPQLVLGPPPFEYAPPKGWSTTAETDGFIYASPDGAHITARYMSPKDRRAPDAQSYIETLAEPPGETLGEATVAGRKARKLERDAWTEFPRIGGRPKLSPVRELHLIVPAAPGWYLLLYQAPRTVYEKHRAAFESSLAGFKPRY